MNAPNTSETTTDEQVLLVVHRHWVSFVQDALVVILPVIFALGLLLFFGGTPGNAIELAVRTFVTLLVPFALLVAWIMLATLWTNYYLDMLVITDRRIFYAQQRRLSNRTILEWRIPEIRHVSVRIGNLLEGLFRFGTVAIEARGEQEPFLIGGIPDPEYIAAVILRQDDRYGELKETARKQRELLHFLSHEVKGHLTKSKAAFASIVEGDYGPIPAPLHSMAGAALADSQQGVDTVMSILENADLSRGSMQLHKRPFELGAAVRTVVDAYRSAAEGKGLALISMLEEPCTVVGDEETITKHVIRNLVENAVRYTPAGKVEVTLTKDGALARLSVADTGVGIVENDMQKLFTQGGHGAHSREINPESTGYGLFIAKRIVDAHDGRIWAQSGGAGTGSIFFVELPLAQ